MEISKASATVGVENSPPGPRPPQGCEDHGGTEIRLGEEIVKSTSQAPGASPLNPHLRSNQTPLPEELNHQGAAARHSIAAAREPILSSWVAIDPASIHLLTRVRRAASSRSPLLICGEPGTGKDLLASLVHYLGPNADQPLLRLDCTEIPRDFLERELFGAEAIVGAGVTHVRRGRLELAGAGAVVMREVSVLDLATQGRLLSALVEGRFRSVGGSHFIPMNARVIALTSTDLNRAVEQGSFREDLYFRFAVVPLVVPPLRQRPRDIRPLADLFLKQFAIVHRKSNLALSPAAVAALQTYTWPGNVGELRHLVELLVLGATRPVIELEDLPGHIRGAHLGIATRMSLEQVERAHIAAVLELTGGNKSAAASILGISRKTLLEKRKRYGLV